MCPPACVLCRGAGTDCGVFMALYGSLGHSGQVKYEAGQGLFKQGLHNIFSLRALDLGDVEHVLVGHDAQGKHKSWHLDWLSIQDMTKRTPPLTFFCGEWKINPGMYGILYRFKTILYYYYRYGTWMHYAMRDVKEMGQQMGYRSLEWNWPKKAMNRPTWAGVC